MDSLLNPDRPPVFCPGCSHERVVHALDKALKELSVGGRQAVIVSDIGCSGLFDTFFHTHAMHGLHGRALTYAAGIKLARPELHVIVAMGDGGMGIGGAHFLSACRRNLDLTLLVLNNFNYGMTGGQCSATTPPEARVSSGFLNRLEKPLDICRTAAAAGAAWAERASSFGKGLVEAIKEAVSFEGFSVLDIWGVCPGRYTRLNRLTPKIIEDSLAKLAPADVRENRRPEYGAAYRREAEKAPPAMAPVEIERSCVAASTGSREMVILGDAGQRIVTAGEILCLAAAAAGLHAAQKNDYPITVMRGHSISEVILSDSEIGYTGIRKPSVVFALGQEGVNRRKRMFGTLAGDCLVVKAKTVDIPETGARILELDFRGNGIKPADWALASVAVLAGRSWTITMEMLDAALALRFGGETLERAATLVKRAAGWGA